MACAVLFWGSAGLLVWVYLAFPAIVALLARIAPRPVRCDEAWQPAVSVIVCAYNEERHVRRKIENCLELDYPPERLEVIIVSDGSIDGTNAILKGLEGARVRVIVLNERRGKTACQNRAAEEARHDVLFFTDATTLHPPEALRRLVRNLADPSVGCASGQPVFRRDDRATSKGLTVRDRYELGLRGRLAAFRTLLGAQDCVYAVRRDLYVPVREDLDSGFVGPLLILEKGYRTVYEPEVLAWVDRPPPGIGDEYSRRSRIVLRGMRGLLHMRRLMNPFRYGFVALALISTRFLRWLTPIFLFFGLAGSMCLAAHPLYGWVLAIQGLFYAAAVAGLLIDRAGRDVSTAFYVPLYFCILAAASATGIARWVVGDTAQTWSTRR